MSVIRCWLVLGLLVGPAWAGGGIQVPKKVCEKHADREKGVALAACPPVVLTDADRTGGPAASGTLASHTPSKKVELSKAVRDLLEDPVLTEGERRRLAIFHGQWDRVDEPSVIEAARIAWRRYDLGSGALVDEGVPVLLRAQAALARGRAGQALELVEGVGTARADLVRARALVRLGRRDQAQAVLVGWRQRLGKQEITDAGELTAAGEMVVLLARLGGGGVGAGRDYHLAMSLFAKARDGLDRLYWPAYVAEARLLIEKDNAGEAGGALMGALKLNPRCGAAWYLLGRLALRGYGFDAAQQCVARLREINPGHVLADLLEIDAALTQKDGVSAVRLCEAVLDGGGDRRRVSARLAAGHALGYDRQKVREVLAGFEQAWPGDALAHDLVGRNLSLARQYDWGRRVLRRAIEIEPAWAQPRVELGLLLMQAGEEDAAREQLRGAVRLDGFNRRAHNQLELAEALAGYERIETEHFVIRYLTGVDEVLARDMPARLEEIYEQVTGVFGYRPQRRTLIEILPDKRYLGVRVIGMPDIWTIAACTGDVIAMAPPREGKGQHGTFDWPRVIRHEFVHTVTLNQTGFRIPHWFTEGCGVWQETGGVGGFDFARCKMLAGAVGGDGLFLLDDIDLAFARPKRAGDRSLAYAQAGWMIEYIVERFGAGALARMLERFRDGAGAAQGIQAVTGQDAQSFMGGFVTWATGEVEGWGLGEVVDDPAVLDLVKHVRGSGGALDAQRRGELGGLLRQYPDHPGLLWVAAKVAVAEGDPDVARGALERYAGARPIDRWADRELVRLAVDGGWLDQAVGSLERLDRAAQGSGNWAIRLARVHRRAGRLDAAAAAVRRAVEHEPYNANYRELAGAIELQRGGMDAALRHVRALTLIEPELARHWVRLAALLHRMGRADQAIQAAQRARELDPNAPVERFMGGEQGK